MDEMPTKPAALINKKIQHVCQQHRVNASELARILEVSPQAATGYFGRTTPSASTLIKLAEHFNVSVYYFGDDEWPVDEPVSDAEMLTDEYLFLEAGKRYAASENRLVRLLTLLERLEWEKIEQALIGGPSKAVSGTQLTAAKDLINWLFFAVQNTLDPFDSVRVARHQTGDLIASIGDAENDRRQHFVDRIDAILARVTTSPQGRSAMMGVTAGAVTYIGDPEAAFMLAEERLAQYHGVDSFDLLKAEHNLEEAAEKAAVEAAKVQEGKRRVRARKG